MHVLLLSLICAGKRPWYIRMCIIVILCKNYTDFRHYKAVSVIHTVQQKEAKPAQTIWDMLSLHFRHAKDPGFVPGHAPFDAHTWECATQWMKHLIRMWSYIVADSSCLDTVGNEYAHFKLYLPFTSDLNHCVLLLGNFSPHLCEYMTQMSQLATHTRNASSSRSAILVNLEEKSIKNRCLCVCEWIRIYIYIYIYIYILCGGEKFVYLLQDPCHLGRLPNTNAC